MCIVRWSGWILADEEPWARKAYKYISNFLTSDIYFLLSKNQTNYYDGWILGCSFKILHFQMFNQIPFKYKFRVECIFKIDFWSFLDHRTHGKALEHPILVTWKSRYFRLFSSFSVFDPKGAEVTLLMLLYRDFRTGLGRFFHVIYGPFHSWVGSVKWGSAT
mgnify:CR=1 FL=1